jgi:hypothetical protein
VTPHFLPSSGKVTQFYSLAATSEALVAGPIPPHCHLPFSAFSQTQAAELGCSPGCYRWSGLYRWDRQVQGSQWVTPGCSGSVYPVVLPWVEHHPCLGSNEKFVSPTSCLRQLHLLDLKNLTICDWGCDSSTAKALSSNPKYCQKD